MEGDADQQGGTHLPFPCWVRTSEFPLQRSSPFTRPVVASEIPCGIAGVVRTDKEIGVPEGDAMVSEALVVDEAKRL